MVLSLSFSNEVENNICLLVIASQPAAGTRRHVRENDICHDVFNGAPKVRSVGAYLLLYDCKSFLDLIFNLKGLYIRRLTVFV